MRAVSQDPPSKSIRKAEAARSATTIMYGRSANVGACPANATCEVWAFAPDYDDPYTDPTSDRSGAMMRAWWAHIRLGGGSSHSPMNTPPRYSP